MRPDLEARARGATAALPLLHRLARSWQLPALLAVVIFATLSLQAAERESPTFDEPNTIAAGYLQLLYNDFRLNLDHPPLLGLLVSPPLLAIGARALPLPPGPVPPAITPAYGYGFFYRLDNPHRRILLLSRLMVLLFSLVAVVVVVRWGFALNGPGGAWLAALLSSFEPNWLAHGHLAARDGICAAGLTLAAAALASFLARPTVWRSLVAGLALGLALAAKHTALLILPVLGLIYLLCTPLAGRFRLVGRDDTPLALSRITLYFALIVGVGFFVVGASYNFGFHYDLYFNGMKELYRLNSPGYHNYCWGLFSTDPIPWYYLLALLVKTPLGYLPLLPLGLVPLRRRDPGLWLPAFLLALVVILAASFNRYNIGLRHVLPVIPLLIVLASGAGQPATLDGRRARWPRLLVIALALLGAVESAWRSPYFLSFFNVAAGGPAGGIRYLDDSNIDWGQDLGSLAELQRAEHLDNLALAYFGSASPPAHGVTARQAPDEELLSPRPGTTYAISLHLLNRIRHHDGAPADWLRGSPWRIAGTSIYLFRRSP